MSIANTSMCGGYYYQLGRKQNRGLWKEVLFEAVVFLANSGSNKKQIALMISNSQAGNQSLSSVKSNNITCRQ